MSASLISMIVTIAFVLLLAIGFLIGLWRGLRKSVISLVFSVVGVIVAFFITPLLVGTVLGISVEINGEIVPLSDIALHIAKDNPDLALLIESNEGVKAFLAGVPSAVANAALFILVTVLIEFLFYFIYLIFSKFVFKQKLLEKKHRLAGAGVGLAKMFIVVVLAFMPFAGLIGTASYIVGEPRPASAQSRQIDDSRLFQNEISNDVKEIASGLENNVLVKICGVFGMDNAMFDYYGTINVNGENVKIREEVINAYDTADAIYQVSKIVNGEGSITSVNFDSLSDTIDKVVQGNLFKEVLCPTLGDIIVNSKNYDFAKDLEKSQPEAMEYLRKTISAELADGGSYHSYFISDFENIFAIVRSFAESGIIDGINGKTTAEIIDFISLNENKTVIKDNINKLFDINFARAFASSAVQAIADSVLAPAGEIDIVSTSNWTEEMWGDVSQNFGIVIDNLITLANEVDFDNPDPANAVLSANLNIVASNLGSAVDGLRRNPLLQATNGENLIDKLLEGQAVDIQLPTEKLKQKTSSGVREVEIRSYTDLINFVLPAVQQIQENNLYQYLNGTADVKTIISYIAQKLSVEGNEDMLSDILLPLIQIDKTESSIVDIFSGNGLIDFGELTTYEEWDSDLEYISEMLIALHNTQIGHSLGHTTALSLVLEGNMEELIDGLPTNSVEAIFKPLFWAKSTTALKSTIVETMKGEIETIVEAGANPITMSVDGITFAEGAEEDQTLEFVDIIKDLIQIAKDYDPATGIQGIDTQLLGGMLDKMKVNANRTENGKTEEGIFGGENGAFVRICDYAKEQYQQDLEDLELVLNHADLLALSEQDKTNFQSYRDNMQAETYENINFTQMLADFVRMTEIKNQIPSGIL